eukprot:TRINITY_DN675_c1_g1_i7.p1 TRINITY_DN675_c1_g1~~TRINITY_DN675_c1_g1_i7.p1  ORF type:complete len:502 (-),score=18.05 TRINITY_DN675_c1_g1_i7:218-1723(-)
MFSILYRVILVLQQSCWGYTPVPSPSPHSPAAPQGPWYHSAHNLWPEDASAQMVHNPCAPSKSLPVMPLNVYCPQHEREVTGNKRHRCSLDNGACGTVLKRICTECSSIVAYGSSGAKHVCPGHSTTTRFSLIDLRIWYKTAVSRRLLANPHGTACHLNAILHALYHCPPFLRCLVREGSPSVVSDAFRALNRVNAPSPAYLLALYRALWPPPLCTDNESDEADEEEDDEYQDAPETLSKLLSLASASVPSDTHPGIVTVTEHLSCTRCSHAKRLTTRDSSAVVRADTLLRSAKPLPAAFASHASTSEERDLSCDKPGCSSKKATRQGADVAYSECALFHISWHTDALDPDRVPSDNGLGTTPWLVDQFGGYILMAVVVFRPAKTTRAAVRGKKAQTTPPHYYTLVRTGCAGHITPPTTPPPPSWLSLPPYVHKALLSPSSPYSLSPDDWLKLDEANDNDKEDRLAMVHYDSLLTALGALDKTHLPVLAFYTRHRTPQPVP